MTTVPSGPLAAYAARLLAGTGLNPQEAARIAADAAAYVPESAAAAAAAMRDGWTAATEGVES